jgi:hypothetical protein
MKKVLCQMCGLMNLEKFITYPHCAGCGTRLAETANPSSSERWKRPLRAPLWATIVGLCCAGLGFWGISIARETSRAEEKQLVAYIQLPHSFTVGQQATVQLTLDSTKADMNGIRNFYEVRMRLPKSTFEDFVLVSVSPEPQTSNEGTGRYFTFDTLPRDEPIVIGLSPRRPGKVKFSFGLYVRDFTPYQWQSSLQVIPQVTRGPRQKMPHSP